MGNRKDYRYIIIQNRYSKLSQDNQEDVASLVVDQAQLNQSVSLFGCKNSTIIIKGKVNAVTLGS